MSPKYNNENKTTSSTMTTANPTTTTTITTTTVQATTTTTISTTFTSSTLLSASTTTATINATSTAAAAPPPVPSVCVRVPHSPSYDSGGGTTNTGTTHLQPYPYPQSYPQTYPQSHPPMQTPDSGEFASLFVRECDTRTTETPSEHLKKTTKNPASQEKPASLESNLTKKNEANHKYFVHVLCLTLSLTKIRFSFPPSKLYLSPFLSPCLDFGA